VREKFENPHKNTKKGEQKMKRRPKNKTQAPLPTLKITLPPLYTHLCPFF